MDILSNQFAGISQVNAGENLKHKVGQTYSKDIKTEFTEKISKDEALELRAQITQNAHEVMLKSVTLQSSVGNPQDKFTKLYEEFQSFLDSIGYEGKSIAELSQDEAAELISEDGIFGIKQTSERIANFVINNAGGDASLLRAGREGMLQGFTEAQKLWGEALPEISQETMKKSIELVDKAMSDLGFSILDQEV